PTTPTLFPYTTLFRSDGISDGIIAINDPYFGLTVPLINASRDVVQEIVNAIVCSDAHQILIDGINSPDANNDLHDRRKREALVKIGRAHVCTPVTCKS